MAAIKFVLETVQLPGTSSVENMANGYRPPVHFVNPERRRTVHSWPDAILCPDIHAR
jgi:hypothetical protein